MNELIVFRHVHQARYAGFQAGVSHPRARHVQAWWPELGPAAISTRTYHRITICEGVDLGREQYELLRTRQQAVENPIWMEL
jgi:hypothetical protein